MTCEPPGQSTVHELKVVPPYFDALVSGAKTFEVRKNDRAYQRGDVLKLREWHPAAPGGGYCQNDGCRGWRNTAHWAECREVVYAEITYVYSGDERFNDIKAGVVVLALKKVGKP